MGGAACACTHTHTEELVCWNTHLRGYSEGLQKWVGGNSSQVHYHRTHLQFSGGDGALLTTARNKTKQNWNICFYPLSLLCHHSSFSLRSLDMKQQKQEFINYFFFQRWQQEGDKIACVAWMTFKFSTQAANCLLMLVHRTYNQPIYYICLKQTCRLLHN